MARVLVVDDAAFMRKMVTDALTKGGHEVIGEASNGIEAVERYHELRPEVTTLDITMPEKDGLPPCRRSSRSIRGPRRDVLGPRAGVQGARVDQDRREGLHRQALPGRAGPGRGRQGADLAFSASDGSGVQAAGRLKHAPAADDAGTPLAVPSRLTPSWTLERPGPLRVAPR